MPAQHLIITSLRFPGSKSSNLSYRPPRSGRKRVIGGGHLDTDSLVSQRSQCSNVSLMTYKNAG